MLTRPSDGEDALQQRLQQWGAKVSVIPLIEIKARTFELPANISAFDWLFFTSKNGVRAFYAQALQEAPDIFNIPVAVVGPVTAQAVRQASGVDPKFISPQFHAKGAAQAFSQAHPGAGKRILWPCGNLANTQLTTGLSQGGASVIPLVVYETTERQPESSELNNLQDKVDMLVFASPSAVRAYAKQAIKNAEQTAITCLGPKTAQTANEILGRVSLQAESATLDALAEAIRHFYTTH